MAENNSNRVSFSRFPPSVFTERHSCRLGERDNTAVLQRVFGKYQIHTHLGITVKATLRNML